MAFPSAIKYGVLKERNSEWKGDFWRTCRALYSGGPTLLGDPEILKNVMPKHNAEEDRVYKERLSRAFYIPYPGSIIDKIVSELTGKPVTIERAPVTEEIFANGAKAVEADEAPLPDFYKAFFEDCSKPGGKKTSINQLAREQILTALQCRYAWTLIDLPKAPEEGYASLADQEKAGALRAYACPIAPENVIDWEEDESGEFTFVLIQEVSCKRDGIGGKRNMIKMTWRYYTPDEFAVYELEYDKIKFPQGPTDRMEAKLVDNGKHTFGRVPVRRLALPEGLWAMGKLEAMARAHLNQRNALSWGQLKAMFPVPILYAQAPNPLDPTSEDAGRTNQRMGPGYLWVMAEKDRMEYFSPDTGPYEVAAADLDRIRDEMHRVLHHMAMSVDNSGAALQRSAESKAIDQVAASVILKALGVILREHLEDVYSTVIAGRKESESTQVCAKGMDAFEDTTLTQLVTDALSLQALNIPSPTLTRKWFIKIAKAALGADATPDEIQEIVDELEENINAETFAQKAEADLVAEEARAATAERERDGEPPPGAAPGKPGLVTGKKPAKGGKPKGKGKKPAPKKK
jgi:hypothetical protein